VILFVAKTGNSRFEQLVKIYLKFQKYSVTSGLFSIPALSLHQSLVFDEYQHILIYIQVPKVYTDSAIENTLILGSACSATENRSIYNYFSIVKLCIIFLIFQYMQIGKKIDFKALIIISMLTSVHEFAATILQKMIIIIIKK